MASVHDWFDEWSTRHMQRFPRPDWPDAWSEFWTGLAVMFVKHGVTEDVADYASQSLMESPPEFLDRHPSALLSRIRAAQRERADTRPTPSQAPSRDAVNFDARAEVAWSFLDEPTRENWRAKVRSRMPMFRKWPDAVEKIARAWNFDPSLVPAEPTEANPGPEDSGSTGGSNPFRERRT